MRNSENFFDEFLLAFVQHLLPGDKDLNIPPASDPEIAAITSDKGTIYSLQNLWSEFEKLFPSAFWQSASAIELLNLLISNPTLLSQFTREIADVLLSSYYQRTDVLTGLGIDGKPPFPQGRSVKQSDLSMLAPVYERGPIYRSLDLE
jgi:hypothetical protein